MSRIGNLPIEIPEKVEISSSKGNMVTVKGPKGELQQQFDPDITVKVEDGEAIVERPTDQKRHKSLHGMYRSILFNMVEGVAKGWKKELELVGVGFRASNTGNLLELHLGYSHPIMFAVPEEVSVETQTEKGKNPLVILESIDRQLVGQVAAKIRSFREPEPYKGKGIRYVGEWIRRKAGKAAAAAAK
jgi:large subunit ribosomal protein L6